MRYILGILLLTVSVGTLSAQEDRDKRRLQGLWKVTGFRVNGNDYPAVNQSYFLFKDRNYAFRKGDKQAGGKFSVRPDKTHKQIDLHILKSANPKEVGHILKGICRQKGDQLELSLAMDGGKNRPQNFTGAVDDEVLVLLLQRQPE